MNKSVENPNICPSCEGEIDSLFTPQADKIWRRIFAAMAMQGFCSGIGVNWSPAHGEVFAVASVKQADALLAALKEPSNA